MVCVRPGVLLVNASLCAHQGVHQAGFPYVTSAQNAISGSPSEGNIRGLAALTTNSAFKEPGDPIDRPQGPFHSMRYSLFRGLDPTTGMGAGIGSATSSRSNAILSTSSIESTKRSFMVRLMASGCPAGPSRSPGARLLPECHDDAPPSTFLQPADSQHLAGRVISPVMATSPRTGMRVSALQMVVARVMPADGPSLGMAPSGRGCERPGCGRNRAATRTGARASGCSSWPPAPIPASHRPVFR